MHRVVYGIQLDGKLLTGSVAYWTVYFTNDNFPKIWSTRRAAEGHVQEYHERANRTLNSPTSSEAAKRKARKMLRTSVIAFDLEPRFE